MINQNLEERSLSKIVFGISKKWKISDKELSQILEVSSTTLEEYKQNGVSVPQDRLSKSFVRVLNFIKLWQSIDSFMPMVQDQLNWLRKGNDRFEGKSAIDFMMGKPGNLNSLLEEIDRFRNP